MKLLIEIGGRTRHNRKGIMMSTIKLRVVYTPYERYQETAPHIGHITATSFREAVLKMLTKVHMYMDKESVEEQEEELGRQLTQEEIIDLLVSENGDGCDCIHSLTNETTGEEYMEDTEPCFEEWEI